MEEYVIVDAYNVIGASEELARLRDANLEEVRNRLLDWLAEYQAYVGRRVVVVFDGQTSDSPEQALAVRGVEVRFTRDRESADEWIERAVRERLRQGNVRLYVVTSDELEQRIAFGWGALRVPAREFLQELARVREEISRRVENIPQNRTPVEERLEKNIAEIFEKWRRNSFSFIDRDRDPPV
ncbi:MAG: NYN domain-containing protein [Alicyclobacillaceae bacterium]|nr:NYN domain-containing protein [Alicyclobacillaceae bacterium]